MVELGQFENEKVELLKGFIVRMSPQKNPQAGVVQYLTHLFVQALVPSGRATARRQKREPQLPGCPRAPLILGVSLRDKVGESKT